MRPALLTEVDTALVAIETADRERDHEKAHGIEDRMVAAVLAAAYEGKTNWRTMARRVLAHLDRVEKYQKPRWQS